MPIYTKKNKKVLFLHIPKTGGISIAHFFDRGGWQTSLDGYSGAHPYYCNRQGSLTHINYKEAEEYYDISSFDFVFSIVRDPYERIVSEYHWQKQLINFNDWFKNEIATLEKNPRYQDNHLICQTNFVGPCTTKVYYFEQGIQNIFDEIENVLGEHFPQKHFHVNNSPRALSVVDINKELVYNFYKEDFETFGYTK